MANCNVNKFTVSILIPVLNEEESIEELYYSIIEVLENQDRISDYEVIFVDDGSTDNSCNKMLELYEKMGNIKIIELRKNFGKSVALAKGFSVAERDILITMDADLQDDPKEIPKLIEKFNCGYDIVTGWKHNRKDGLIRALSSKFFNFFVSLLSGLKLHDVNCGLKLYSKDVYKKILIYGEQHRLIPMIAHMMGFKIAEVPVVHHCRKYGSSKYKTFRLQGFFDAISIYFVYSYRNSPLYIFGLIAIPMFFIGFSVFNVLAFMHVYYMLTGNIDYILNVRPLLILSLALVIIAIQLIMTGLIGEWILNILYRSRFVRNDDLYEVKQIIGLKKK